MPSATPNVLSESITAEDQAQPRTRFRHFWGVPTRCWLLRGAERWCSNIAPDKAPQSKQERQLDRKLRSLLLDRGQGFEQRRWKPADMSKAGHEWSRNIRDQDFISGVRLWQSERLFPSALAVLSAANRAFLVAFRFFV